MKDVSTQSQSDQPTTQTRKCFFAALNVSNVDRLWRVRVVGSRISSRWGCTDLEESGQSSWTKSGAYISLFTCIHHAVCFLTYLRSLWKQREPGKFHSRKPCDISEGQANSSVNRSPLYCRNSWRRDQNCGLVSVFILPFFNLFWASGRAEHCI